MSGIVTTILLATGVLLVALLFFAIGWLITGKNRIIRGACGMDPNKVRDKRCGTKDIKCDLCGTKKGEETEEE
ncbi:MAG: hypothetical protein KDK48_05065 [Chlamydiia bacterium]|nr:hypothetical protein [Chlamydiia bacterium]